MRRKFRVTIGEKTFMVEVEEVSVEAISPMPISEAPTPPAKPMAERRAPEAPGMGITGEEGVVRAPMPGTILSIKCEANSEVKAGDLLLTLEAMKMENEIYAPKSGVIKKIAVSEGQSVKHDEVLVVID